MLIANNIPIAMLGTPSVKGNIYDVSLYNCFESKIYVYSGAAYIGNLANMVGIAHNYKLSEGIITTDIEILMNNIVLYDALVHRELFIRMYLVHDSVWEETVNPARVIAMYIGDDAAWKELENVVG